MLFLNLLFSSCLKIGLIPDLVRQLIRGKQTWADVEQQFGLFEGQTTNK